MSATGRAAPAPAPSYPERLAPPPISPPPLRQSDRPRSPASSEALSTYLAALRKHLRLVLALPLTMGVIAVPLSMARSRQYEARAAFIASEPQSMSGTLGALSSVASQLGVPGLSAVASSSATGSAQFYGDLLTTNAILHAVVMTPFDANNPGENGGEPFRGTLIDYVKPDAKVATDREIGVMKVLAKSILVVAVDRPTSIVRIKVKTKNRLLSALVTRRFLDLVNDFNLRRRQTQAGAERDFGARRLQAALDTLHAAEIALADFRATNIDFSRSPRLGTRDAELQRRVTLAQQSYTTAAQRYEVASIEAVRNTPVVTVLDSPEGLVEALPRHTAAIAAGAFVLGLIIACAVAIRAEANRLRD